MSDEIRNAKQETRNVGGDPLRTGEWAGMAAAFALHAQEVSFAYAKTPVVENVSLRLEPGELVALVGPNGCGKSTLLQLLLGHRVPSAGTVRLNGADLRDLPPPVIAQHVALVPQNASAGFSFTVRQIVLMGRWPWHGGKGLRSVSGTLGFETPADQRLAEAAMWTLDILHLADRPFQALSGGERQRTVIARALCQQTPAMLLDEPTSALDLWHQLELLHHLKTLTRERKTAVLVVTHDLNLALQWADRAVVMDRGKIVAAGPPGQTLTPEVLRQVYWVNAELRDGQLRFQRT